MVTEYFGVCSAYKTTFLLATDSVTLRNTVAKGDTTAAA